MAKDFSKSFYNSKAWECCRLAYIEKRITVDGGMCERCKERTGYILHHKVELNALNICDPNVTLNHCNLEFLCKECHDDIHLLHKKTGFVFFDETGHPKPKGNSPR